MDLQDILRKTKTLAVDYDGWTVMVEVRTNMEGKDSISYAERATTLAGGDPLAQHAYGVDALLAYVIRWDLTESGDPLPVDRETLERLPLALLWRIFTVIIEAINPNPQTGTTSDNGSGAKGQLVVVPTSIDSN